MGDNSTNIARWGQDPDVKSVLSIIKCEPWKPGWHDICAECKESVSGLTNLMTRIDKLTEDLADAQKRVEQLEAREAHLLDMVSTALWQNATFGTEHFFDHDSKGTREQILRDLDNWIQEAEHDC